jgi:hypothetical protein
MCIKNLVSCLLTLANMVIMLAGVAILTVGAVIQWGGAPVYRFISPVFGAIVSTSSAVGQSNFSTTVQEISSLMGQYTSFLSSAGLILFGVGVFVAILGAVGCIGACCTLKILLLAYVICVGIIFLLSLIFVIVLFASRPSVEKWGAEGLKIAIENHYVGFNDSKQTTDPEDGVSRILDVIQVQLNCCGVVNYTDFNNAKKWNRDYYYNKERLNLTTPLSCCKMKGYGITPIDPRNCAISPLNESLNNFATGCYPKLWQAVDKYSLYFAYSVLGFTLVLFIDVVLTAWLIKMAAKDDFTCL